jgi:hypothetical protein
MDIRLKYEIIEPWLQHPDNDIGNHLYSIGIKYRISCADNSVKYVSELSLEDLLALKIIFPDILIRPLTDKKEVNNITM